MKRIAIIPTLLTLGNAVCGFAAIASASKIGHGDAGTDNEFYFAFSGGLILAAMVFDALDGYVARISKTTSNFGKELDSLCDAVSFGVAPAYLLLRLGPDWTHQRIHQALAVIATLYMVCAILRLARFNIETALDPNSSKRFRGLPSPGAAAGLATLGILRGAMAQRWPSLSPETIRICIEWFSPFGALAVALLMVSRIPYPHLAKQILRGRRPFSHLVQVVVMAFLLVLLWDVALVLTAWVYALGIPTWYLVTRSLRRGLASPPTPAPGLDDALPH